MSRSEVERLHETMPAPGGKAWLFALVTAFSSTMGVGIISPVVPFLVQPYLRNPDNLALVVGLLTSSYAICQFIAAPTLGALSDRYGRRPVLLICLFGSVIGYLLFGMGGALWVLFTGRIIDGLTGGNISTLFAYVADITPPEKRGQQFGKIGAATGVGFICGPLIGGLAARFGYAAPLYVGAAVTFANMAWGYFFMPETLDASLRAQAVPLAQLNPFKQLRGVLALGQLRWLLIATFLHTIPFTILASNLALLTKDALRWQPAAIGMLLFAFGLQDALTQGFFVQRLLPRFGEAKVAIGATILEIAGYALIALAAYTASAALLVTGFILFGLGESSFGPSLGGLISRRVGPRDQGRVQGSNQSLQALARMTGPILGGQLYTSGGRAAPYLFSVFVIAGAMAAVWQTLSPERVGIPAATPQDEH
jgi:MFS transporter, DHA1 family, tetracycline resistance protein